MNYKLLVKNISYVLSFFVICVIIWLAINNLIDNGIFYRNAAQASLINSEIVTANNIVATIPDRNWDVKEVELGAKSSLCVEGDKVLFNENENQRLAIASLTKLMSATIVLENYDLNMVNIVSRQAYIQSGEQGLLVEGEMLSLNNLLYIMLIESSNDAAYSLAEVMGVDKFVEQMNAKARIIGLSNTNFVDPSGLGADNYSTADDLVKLTKYLLDNHPIIFGILSNSSYNLYLPSGKLHHVLQNTNELLGKVPGLVAGKTGNTTEAKGCLLLIVKNEYTEDNLIYIILGSDDRFGEMQRLINWVNQAYNW